jgi:hypothetical protein
MPRVMSWARHNPWQLISLGRIFAGHFEAIGGLTSPKSAGAVLNCPQEEADGGVLGLITLMFAVAQAIGPIEFPPFSIPTRLGSCLGPWLAVRVKQVPDFSPGKAGTIKAWVLLRVPRRKSVIMGPFPRFGRPRRGRSGNGGHEEESDEEADYC